MVGLKPRLPPPNALFTAAKRLVYRRQTTRLPSPPELTLILLNIKCKRLHKKLSEIYLAVSEKCINFAARSYNFD